LYRRSEDIIEIQEGTVTDSAIDACSPANMNSVHLPYTILLSKKTGIVTAAILS
jgi:hypothetical protein